jgi:protein-tyrosine kinase
MGARMVELYEQKNKSVQDSYINLFTNLSIENKDKKVRSIVVSSCKPCVGKTDVAINLSLAAAKLGCKVLFVDADLRKPLNTKHLNTSDISGLSDYLTGDTDFNEIVCDTNISNLFFVSSGRSSENYIGILRGTGIDNFIKSAKEVFEYIIFDTPSLSAVIDASLIAPKTDGAILVAELGLTTVKDLKPVKEQLLLTNSKILGVIMNRAKRKIYRAQLHEYDYFSKIKKDKIKK